MDEKAVKTILICSNSSSSSFSRVNDFLYWYFDIPCFIRHSLQEFWWGFLQHDSIDVMSHLKQ